MVVVDVGAAAVVEEVGEVTVVVLDDGDEVVDDGTTVDGGGLPMTDTFGLDVPVIPVPGVVPGVVVGGGGFSVTTLLAPQPANAAVITNGAASAAFRLGPDVLAMARPYCCHARRTPRRQLLGHG
jgi:hypothetical protein